MNDSEAKEFFIQKILDQARKENINLSDVEKQMLSWRDTDPNFYENHELNERFENEISKGEYEKKIARLIRSGYDDDLGATNVARETYEQAYKAIKSKDYYIFIAAIVMSAVDFHENLKGELESDLMDEITSLPMKKIIQ